jgi:septum formation protein
VQLILASGSPRRLALLEQLGLSPVVRPADIDETPLPDEKPAAHVERLALEKGAAVDAEHGDTVISADTIVTIDGALLGKPRDEAHAATMLRQLSGRPHQVMTGVAVRSRNDTTSFVETTIVHFAELTDNDIAWYVATGEPADKAGAYALQGRGGAFVTSIEGSYDNVIGLPRYRLRDLLDLSQ